MAEFAWDKTAQPPVFQYRLTQPASEQDNPLTTDWITNLGFKAAGVPDRVVFSTERHDHDSRDLAVYEVTLNASAEAQPQ